MAFQNEAPFFIRQREARVQLGSRGRVISWLNAGRLRADENEHQIDGAANLAGNGKRAIEVGQGGLRMAEHPGRQRAPAYAHQRGVRGESRRRLPMLGRIVKRDRLVEVRPAWPDFAAAQRGATDETMSDHDRNGLAQLARRREELRRKIRGRLLIERHVVYGPKAVQNPK